MLSSAFEIQRLRVLVEVGRTGSVSAAADALRLSQPTVSVHLKTLSTMLGVPVAERRGRRTELTEAGRVLERSAARALADLERAQEQIEAHRDVASGSLRIGAGTTPGTYVLPRILGEFHRRHAGVELRLEVASSAVVLDLVARGDLHLGVIGEAGPQAGVERRPLLTDRLVCVAPPAHPAAAAGRITRNELSRQVLLARKPGSSSQAIADDHLRRSGLRTGERWELDSPEAIKQAVRAGLGIAFVSELAAREEIQDGRLAVLEVEAARAPARTLDLVRSATHSLTPAERAFMALVDEKLGDGTDLRGGRS